MDVLRGSILAKSSRKKREYVEKSWLWHLLETVLWFSSGGWGFQQVSLTMCVISAHSGAPSTPLVPWKCSRCKYHFQILIKYALSLLIAFFLSSSGHCSGDEFMLIDMALGMFLEWNHWLGQVSNCLTPLSFELELRSHTFCCFCLISAAFVPCCVNLPNPGHAMCFLFGSTLLTEDSLDKFLLENFLGS